MKRFFSLLLLLMAGVCFSEVKYADKKFLKEFKELYPEEQFTCVAAFSSPDKEELLEELNYNLGAVALIFESAGTQEPHEPIENDMIKDEPYYNYWIAYCIKDIKTDEHKWYARHIGRVIYDYKVLIIGRD